MDLFQKQIGKAPSNQHKKVNWAAGILPQVLLKELEIDLLDPSFQLTELHNCTKWMVSLLRTEEL